MRANANHHERHLGTRLTEAVKLPRHQALVLVLLTFVPVPLLTLGGLAIPFPELVQRALAPLIPFVDAPGQSVLASAPASVHALVILDAPGQDAQSAANPLSPAAAPSVGRQASRANGGRSGAGSLSLPVEAAVPRDPVGPAGGAGSSDAASSGEAAGGPSDSPGGPGTSASGGGAVAQPPPPANPPPPPAQNPPPPPAQNPPPPPAQNPPPPPAQNPPPPPAQNPPPPPAQNPPPPPHPPTPPPQNPPPPPPPAALPGVLPPVEVVIDLGLLPPIVIRIP